METPRGKNSKKEIDVDRKINKAVRSQVQNMIRVRQELKSYDQGISSNATSTGSLTQMFAPAQDDSDSGRNGDSVNVIKITGRWYSSAADVTNTVRLTVFRWQSNNSADPPAIADVYQTSASPWISEFVRDNLRSGILQVLYDEIQVVTTNGPGICLSPKIVLKWKALKVNFDATTTTGKGMLYIALSSDSTASTHPTAVAYFRTWYTDS